MLQSVVNLLGIMKIRDGFCLPLIAEILGVRIELKKLRTPEPADRGVSGRPIEKGRKRPRIAQGAQRSVYLEPRLLQQLPGISFGSGKPAKVIKQRLLPQLDDALEGASVAALPANDQ